MGEMYYGRGNASQRDDYLDFINLVFGFNGKEQDFMKLLPGLYKEEYDPCYNNFIATEDGKFRAAVGVYPRTFSVMGEELLSHGIGNVAVHPYHRSKGYMKTLMNMALDDMIDAGADFSDLGGQRQRYQYFGFDNAGCNRVFNINQTNIRHNFKDAPAPSVHFRRLQVDDPMLDDVAALYNSKIVHTCRPRERMCDIMGTIYAVLRKEDDSFCGFFTGELGGLTLTSNDLYYEVLRAYLTDHNSVDIHLPPFETELISLSHAICGSCRINSAVKIAVFRFRRMLTAYLKLKAATEGLVDGIRQYRITGINAGHGNVRDEEIRISVCGGALSVSDIDAGAPVTEIAYMDALSLFFDLASPARTCDPVASQWFPLPINIDGCDHV